ncbi:hypothetical protein SMC26_17760 [Actinomadura fulvescens]|uniref:DUF5666 domain-containing protein n=1 Tax=Actinomadura fulvescens TaxID=46160 RepID=A0ABN3PXW9_9ACTN
MNEPDVLETSPFKGDLDAELAAPPRPRLGPGPTAYLGAGILLVAGFLGGVQAEKAWSNGDPTQPAGRTYPGSQPSYAGGQRGFGGPGSLGSSGSGELTTGTIVKVVGNTVHLRTADGKTVKVTTSGATKVRVTKAGTVKDLKSGTSVVVRGSAAKDGTVTATTVNQGGSLRP